MSTENSAPNCSDTLPEFPVSSVEVQLIQEFTYYVKEVETQFSFTGLSFYPTKVKKIAVELYLKEKLITAELCHAKAMEMARLSSMDYFGGAVIYWQSCCSCIRWLLSQLDHSKRWNG